MIGNFGPSSETSSLQLEVAFLFFSSEHASLSRPARPVSLKFRNIKLKTLKLSKSTFFITLQVPKLKFPNFSLFIIRNFYKTLFKEIPTKLSSNVLKFMKWSTKLIETFNNYLHCVNFLKNKSIIRTSLKNAWSKIFQKIVICEKSYTNVNSTSILTFLIEERSIRKIII